MGSVDAILTQLTKYILVQPVEENDRQDHETGDGNGAQRCTREKMGRKITGQEINNRTKLMQSLAQRRPELS